MVYCVQVSIGYKRVQKETTLTHGNREDKDFVAREGKQKAFLKGSNSSCRQHARKHWGIYKKKCEDAEIPVHHWAIPRQVWNEMESKKGNNKKKNEGEAQATLDHVFQKMSGPREFTRDGILHTVAQFVACDDQVHRACYSCCKTLKNVAVVSGGRQGTIPKLFSSNETEIDTKRRTKHS